jgi:hypothetical protein
MTLVMLAGSTLASSFSLARIWPLASSISSQALPVIEGGGGVGIEAATDSGVGTGMGAGVWAEALATMTRKSSGQRKMIKKRNSMT